MVITQNFSRKFSNIAKGRHLDLNGLMKEHFGKRVGVPKKKKKKGKK